MNVIQAIRWERQSRITPWIRAVSVPASSTRSSVRSTLVLPPWHVKYSGQIAKMQVAGYT